MGIKRNAKGKWSVKGSDKYITYERIIDLRKENLEELKQYNLKKAIYIYVGQCGEAKIDDRHSKFIWDIKNKITGNKNIHIFPEMAQTYLNIIRFFKDKKNMTQKEVENYLFRNEDNFFIVYEGLTKEESEKKEKDLYHSYLAEIPFTTEIVLLKNRDSQLEVDENSIKLKKSKKKEDFNAVEMKFIYKNNKFYLKFNDTEYEMEELKFIPIIKEYGTIGEHKKIT